MARCTRYGTQSAAGADAFNSIASLEKTMRRVLALHEDYPNNKNGLAGKLGKLKPYKIALKIPGMKHRAKRNYEGGGRKTTPDVDAQRQTHTVRLAADRWRLKKAEG